MMWNISSVVKNFNDIGQEVLVIEGFRNNNEILHCNITKSNLIIELNNNFEYDESRAISVVKPDLVYLIEVGMGINQGKVANMMQRSLCVCRRNKIFWW